MHSEIQAILGQVSRYSVESGMDHPTEKALEEFVLKFGHLGVYPLVFVYAKARSSSVLADTLRLLSRCELVPMATRYALVRRAIQSKDLDVRDAAVTSAENWGGVFMAELLAYEEKDPGLSEYKGRVIVDLKGAT